MAGNKEERNKEVFWGKCSRTYYPRRCKRNRLTNIESLPNDLFLEILARVPAQDIYHLTRFVCWKWYHMIHTRNFLHAHLQHTTYGLLFQDFFFNLCFVALQQGRIEISKIDYKFRCEVQGSCNGFFLELLTLFDKNLYVTNPVLKQKFILPPFHRKIPHSDACGIAYSAATQEYKVFLTYFVGIARGQLCSILTVGVDNSWRDLDTQHLSVKTREIFRNYPLITEGFMHWAVDGIQVLTLNVETEIITETPAPIPQVYAGQNRKMYYYLSGGRYLSLLVACKKYWFEVWEMKPVTGEWRKVCSVVLEGQVCKFEECGLKQDEYLKPVGWLKYREVLVFGTSKARTFISCNLLTQEMNLFKPPLQQLPPAPYKLDQRALSCGNYSVVVHKNTLSWFN